MKFVLITALSCSPPAADPVGGLAPSSRGYVIWGRRFTKASIALHRKETPPSILIPRTPEQQTANDGGTSRPPHHGHANFCLPGQPGGHLPPVRSVYPFASTPFPRVLGCKHVKDHSTRHAGIRSRKAALPARGEPGHAMLTRLYFLNDRKAPFSVSQ